MTLSYTDILNKRVVPNKVYQSPPYIISYKYPRRDIYEIESGKFEIETKLEKIDGIYRIILIYPFFVDENGNRIYSDYLGFISTININNRIFLYKTYKFENKELNIYPNTEYLIRMKHHENFNHYFRL